MRQVCNCETLCDDCAQDDLSLIDQAAAIVRLAAEMDAKPEPTCRLCEQGRPCWWHRGKS